MPIHRRPTNKRPRNRHLPQKPAWIIRQRSNDEKRRPRVARLKALTQFVDEVLATPALEPVKRAEYEERVDRAIAELYGERPDERRALLYNTIRACAWDNDPPVPVEEQGLLAPLAQGERLQRRARLVLRSMADVDPLFAETLHLPLIEQALETFSNNKGGHHSHAQLSREDAMRQLLAATPVGAVGMKRIRHRAPRRPPK